ncbi:MAG: asparaginase [Clostridiales bacterium]|nr:asparaginase [Clostridiales bacterium]
MGKRFILLATGGTIASIAGENGLHPGISAAELISHINTPRHIDIIGRDVFALDSSNIQPEEWQVLSQAVRQALREADGVLITHGTDTMAYTAAALSFMLLGENKPVVLTGSQLPIGHPLSDAPSNFLEAISVLEKAERGVYVVFHHKVILGTRAVKMRTTGFDAFHSVNAPLFGHIDAEGPHLSPAPRLFPLPARPDALESRVFLLKLIPGTSIETLDWVANAGYRGLVIEAFGLGGFHYIRRNLVDKLQEISAKGVITLVTTQCIYEKANFSLYEVGRNVLSQRVFSARDMTSEAAVAKLMWVLGDEEHRLPLLAHSLCGEMSENP